MEKNILSTEFPKVGIIVLNWNGKKDTLLCLESLCKTSYPNIEIIVVDNGSTDDSIESIQKAYPHVTLLTAPENLGYAGGNNVGISYGLKKGFAFFLILNNDTVVDPHLIERFLEGFNAYPEAGILGAKVYLLEEPLRFDHFGGIWKPSKLNFTYVGRHVVDDGKSWETPLALDYVSGACLMIRQSVFEAIGLFDPRYFLYWEETDFCFKARKKGFAIMTCPQAKLWHKVSASSHGSKPHATYFFWRNRLLWMELNFYGTERLYYFLRFFCLEIPLLYKLKGLKSLQLFLAKIFSQKEEKIKIKKEFLFRLNAALYGSFDYVFRRFGKGRSSLFLKKP